MTDLVRIVSSADGHSHPLEVPGYDSENPVSVPPTGDFDLLSVMSPETLHAMKDELSLLVTDGKLTSVQTVTVADLWNMASGGSVSGLTSLVTINDSFPASAGAHSHQSVSADLTLEATSGSSTAGDPKFLAAIMGNLHGPTLTATENYDAGVIGALDATISGDIYPSGGVMGIIFDGSTGSDGAVVAVIDGNDPSSVTTARAAFAVRINNNNPGSGCSYGLDLFDAGNPDYTGGGVPFTPSIADIRLSNGTTIAISGDVITFSNPNTGHSATITMS